MTRVKREKWTAERIQEVVKGENNDRVKRSGIEEDRQIGPRMTVRRDE